VGIAISSTPKEFNDRRSIVVTVHAMSGLRSLSSEYFAWNVIAGLKTHARRPQRDPHLRFQPERNSRTPTKLLEVALL
jgi:hypothetical protein